MKNKITILGGDLRQYTAAVTLSRKDWEVALWGLDISDNKDENICFYKDYRDAVDGAVGVVLPLPASTDGIFLNCPFGSSQDKLRLNDILETVEKDCIIVGGRIPDDFIDNAKKAGILVNDYFLSEDFQIKNAYITAEAAISIAMNSLNKNICGAKIAITGYGRIAKHLIRLLSAMGANLTVAARKTSDLAWAACNGCSTLRIGDSAEQKRNIYELAHGYDIIYNTVPYWLFDRSFLEISDRNTFIIDLASAPGGVDIRAAKELGSNVLWATSLPGKYAPVSAGTLIASCVDSILHGEVTEL